VYKLLEVIVGNEKVLKTLGKVFRFLPKFLIFGICRFIGLLMYRFGGPLRERIRMNMDQLLQQNRHDIQSHVRKYFHNVIITLYEIIFASQTLDSKNRTKFFVKEERYLQEALEKGRGAIVFTPHSGNFFYYYWYLSRKYPCLTVATAGSKELLPLYLIFQRLGCKGLDYDTTPPLFLIRKIQAHLKTNGVVFILGDFWRPTFPNSTFFNRPSRSPNGAAMMGLEHGVPIVPFYGHHKGKFVHQLCFGAPIYLDQEFSRTQRREATDRLNRLLEAMIKDKPDQWFYWFNVDERWERTSEKTPSI
jgi:lauroyl/myristoyl acyltransferase